MVEISVSVLIVLSLFAGMGITFLIVWFFGEKDEMLK